MVPLFLSDFESYNQTVQGDYCLVGHNGARWFFLKNGRSMPWPEGEVL